MRQKKTDLEMLIVGLLAGEPKTGYGVRQIFAASPMGVHSDSPGSIYPAIKRLVTAGLLDASGSETDKRGRTLYRASTTGLTALKEWMRYPELEPHEIGKALSTLMVRYSLMSFILPPKEQQEFVERLTNDFDAWEKYLRDYFNENAPNLPETGRQAMELGLLQARAQCEWANNLKTPS